MVITPTKMESEVIKSQESTTVMDIVEVPLFPDVELRQWISWMEQYFARKGLTDLEKLHMAHGFIVEEAELYVNQINSIMPIRNWKEMKETLMLKFGVEDDPEKIRLRIQSDRCHKFIMNCNPLKRHSQYRKVQENVMKDDALLKFDRKPDSSSCETKSIGVTDRIKCCNVDSGVDLRLSFVGVKSVEIPESEQPQTPDSMQNQNQVLRKSLQHNRKQVPLGYLGMNDVVNNCEKDGLDFSNEVVHEATLVRTTVSPILEEVSFNLNDCHVQKCSSPVTLSCNDSRHAAEQGMDEEVKLDDEEFSNKEVVYEKKGVQVVNSSAMEQPKEKSVDVSSLTQSYYVKDIVSGLDSNEIAVEESSAMLQLNSQEKDLVQLESPTVEEIHKTSGDVASSLRQPEASKSIDYIPEIAHEVAWVMEAVSVQLNATRDQFQSLSGSLLPELCSEFSRNDLFCLRRKSVVRIEKKASLVLKSTFSPSTHNATCGILSRSFRSQQSRKLRLFPKSWKFKFKGKKQHQLWSQTPHKLISRRHKLHKYNNVYSRISVGRIKQKKPIQSFRLLQHSNTSQFLRKVAFGKNRDEEALTTQHGRFTEHRIVLNVVSSPEVLHTHKGRQMNMCKMGMNRVAHELHQFILDEGNFKVKHKWRFKQLTQASLWALEQVAGIITDLQPFGSCHGTDLITFISSSLRASLFSRAGVYMSRWLTMDVLIWLSSTSMELDLLRKNGRRQKEKEELSIQWLVQDLIHILRKGRRAKLVQSRDCGMLSVYVSSHFTKKSGTTHLRHRCANALWSDWSVDRDNKVRHQLQKSKLPKLWRFKYKTRNFGIVCSSTLEDKRHFIGGSIDR